MLKFYELGEKVQTLSTQLTWSHYCELLSLNNIDKINYYVKITEENNLSVRELRNKIKNNEYERLDNKTKKIKERRAITSTTLNKEFYHIKNK